MKLNFTCIESDKGKLINKWFVHNIIILQCSDYYTTAHLTLVVVAVVGGVVGTLLLSVAVCLVTAIASRKKRSMFE